MRLVHIRVASVSDRACLMRELSVYSPKLLQKAVVIELDKPSQTDLLALLSAIETCLTGNDIRSVRISIDGKAYMMTSPSRR